jgi:hypothetical protein
MNAIDWVFLKRPLIFFAIAIVICAGLVFAGLHYEQSAETNYQSAINKLRSTHSRYENMVNDIDLLEQYTNRFTHYKATGLVGADRRLSWVESLEAANATIQLPKLTYNLLAEEGFSRGGFKVGRNVEVTSSPMELQISMLHEGDLFDLIDGLSNSINNLFSVDSCTLTLTNALGQSFKTNRPNLTGRCVIRWISIDAK